MEERRVRGRKPPSPPAAERRWHVDRTELLLRALEGALNTAFEAVEELDALVRAELGGDPSPIGQVQSGYARQALHSIREAGKELRPISLLAAEPARRIGRAGELLATAVEAVVRLDSKLCLLRGRGEDRGQSNSARIALAALRLACRRLARLAENLGA
jgi:hypothetical protein